MGGELQNPKKNLSRVMIVTISGITVLYLLFNLAIMHVVPIADIISSENVTFDVVEIIFGKGAAIVITLAIICSVIGSLNSCILVYPREIYAMSQDRRWFAPVSYTHLAREVRPLRFLYAAKPAAPFLPRPALEMDAGDFASVFIIAYWVTKLFLKKDTAVKNVPNVV